MNTQKKARSLYWDIVKGWGIIAIVLGHTGYFAGAFVYLFHLALFFFITGYFYNETKYGDTPFLYFGDRPPESAGTENREAALWSGERAGR